MSSDHTVRFKIQDTEYSVRVVRRMNIKADQEIYHLESYRESSFLAKTFVTKLSGLNLCDKLKIPVMYLSAKERITILNSVIATALEFTASDETPDLTDYCGILYDDQKDRNLVQGSLILYRARNVDYEKLVSLAFDILPGVSDLVFLEALSFPVKRALRALHRSANYTFLLSLPYCSLKTTLLNCLSNFAQSNELLNRSFTDYSNAGALLLNSQEYYGLNYILDDAGNKGLFRPSAIERRREDLDNIITFNADRNERSNIILCAEDYHGLGRLSTYSRLLIVSHSKPEPERANHMMNILDQIQKSTVCGFYLDFYQAIQKMSPDDIDRIFKSDGFYSHVRSNVTLRIGRHTHVLYVVWNLLRATLLQGSDTEMYTKQILQHLQLVINKQEAFETKMLGTPADPVCLTLKLIESDYLKKYDDKAEYEKHASWSKACYIDRFQTESIIRSDVLCSALREAYNMLITKNSLNKKLAQAGVIKTASDGRNTANVNNKRYLVINLMELKAYVSFTTGFTTDID
ncbi:hypothetical protein [Butyrivibrio sp. FCS006]|uniref:hypothetical protein n=1 Tax=Butyrivibrio sp. FCS006 TaxID=1280684 RepID=UPI000422A884|nr:hypothetical protein [Butyrivibrio sp. FCS006]